MNTMGDLNTLCQQLVWIRYPENFTKKRGFPLFFNGESMIHLDVLYPVGNVKNIYHHKRRWCAFTDSFYRADLGTAKGWNIATNCLIMMGEYNEGFTKFEEPSS